MQVTEEQRDELERHGFVVLDGDVLADPASGRAFSIDGALPRAAEAAAILGIAPPGYRLVPEETLQRVEALRKEADGFTDEALAASYSKPKPDWWRVANLMGHARAKYCQALDTIASALQGKEMETRD